MRPKPISLRRLKTQHPQSLAIAGTVYGICDGVDFNAALEDAFARVPIPNGRRAVLRLSGCEFYAVNGFVLKKQTAVALNFWIT